MERANFTMEWSWKTFLLPLSDDDLTYESSSREVKVEPLQIPPDSLVERFSFELLRQDTQRKKEKTGTIFSAEYALCSLFPSEFYPTALKYLGKKREAYKNALNIKSDRNIPGSTWTIDILQKYIKRSDIIFIQPSHATAQEAQNILDNVALSLASLCGYQSDRINENLRRFHRMRDSTKADSRMILDAILQPLCATKKLTLRCDQGLSCNTLPNNRYDYIIYYGRNPIGVVAAKPQSGVYKKSVAQLIVQLLLLSAKDARAFRFGVLSDAHRFILAGVSEEKVVFFQANVHAIQIRFMKSEADLLSIADDIAWLIDLAVKSSENKRSIEGYLSGDVCHVVDCKFFL